MTPRQAPGKQSRRGKLAEALHARRRAVGRTAKKTVAARTSREGGRTSERSRTSEDLLIRTSTSRHKDGIKLSKALQDKVEAALRNAWAPSTLKAYNGAVRDFLAFCDKEAVDQKHRLPAEEVVLCAFAASGVGRRSGATVREQIAGLEAWHVVQGVGWRGSERLRHILRGVEKLQPPPPPRETPCLAVMTKDNLRGLHRNLDFKAPFDAAVFAAACTLFWGQCRAGELLPSSTTPAGCAGRPTRGDFHAPSKYRANYSVYLPSARGESVALLPQKGSTDPVQAMRYHLHVNRYALDGETPLFAYKTAYGSSRPLTKEAFLRRCNDVWRARGQSQHTGECFRIGGATELLLAGAAPHVVKMSGRWSDDAFLRDWPSTGAILAMHMERIRPAKW
jgi:hypothetical protein